MARHGVTRRRLLQGTLAAPYVIPALAADTLVVNGYGAEFQEIITRTTIEPFEKKFGVQVTYDSTGTAAQNYAKIRASRGAPGFDVAAELTPPEIILGQKEKLLEPISEAETPNLKYVWPNSRKIIPPTGVGNLTFDNFTTLLSNRLYLNAILRSVFVGIASGAIVVVLAYPLAYFLVRTTSRWKNLLIALSLAPLLASVIVRTYGWWVVLNREGALNVGLRSLGIIDQPLIILPSTVAIIIGLAHALLPYGVLTIMASLNGLNPSLERAAMSLGAGRTRTFLAVTLPMSTPGIAGGFLLTFAIAISAYATPAILGGPNTEVMATMIRRFMLELLEWSLGSAMGAILLVSATLLLLLTGMLAGRRQAAS